MPARRRSSSTPTRKTQRDSKGSASASAEAAEPAGGEADVAAVPAQAAYPQEALLPSNPDLTQLLHKAMTRLENWRIELETNPNPRMVHVLRNILGHIESMARITESKAVFSYKHLSRQMSVLIGEVAQLNLAITESLDEDDIINSREEKRINAGLKTVVEAAVELIRIVQQGFMLGRDRPALTYTGNGTAEASADREEAE